MSMTVTLPTSEPVSADIEVTHTDAGRVFITGDLSKAFLVVKDADDQVSLMNLATSKVRRWKTTWLVPGSYTEVSPTLDLS